MFGSDRGDRGALIALGLILAAIVFVACICQPGGTPVSQESKANVEQSGQDNISDIVAQPVLSDNIFHPWRDSVAQWLMMIFAALATGVSFYAVILLNQTLGANRDAAGEAGRAAAAAFEANEIARKIGSAQTRPYVGVSNMIARFEETGRIVIFAGCKNSGSSPARRVWATLEAHRIPSGSNPNRHFSKNKYVRQADIHPGDAPIIADFVPSDGSQTQRDVVAGLAIIDAIGVISYRDNAWGIHRTLFHSELDVTKCPRHENGSYTLVGHPRGNYST